LQNIKSIPKETNLSEPGIDKHVQYLSDAITKAIENPQAIPGVEVKPKRPSRHTINLSKLCLKLIKQKRTPGRTLFRK